MLILISPAKTLDFETPAKTRTATQPVFLEDSKQLIEELQKLPSNGVSKLMSISSRLGDLNHERFMNWRLPFTKNNAKQCVLAFKGDVYTGLDAQSLSKTELKFAQDHLRILSGLYGVLRPLDLMQAYRLEMGSSLKNERGTDLYSFWGDRITEAINQSLIAQNDNIVINLASNEYFKSVKPKQLNARIITPVFKDRKSGQYKLISFFAKKARGLMARYIIQNQLTDPEDIKTFDVTGYSFSKRLTKADKWVFTRKESVPL